MTTIHKGTPPVLGTMTEIDRDMSIQHNWVCQAQHPNGVTRPYATRTVLLTVGDVYLDVLFLCSRHGHLIVTGDGWEVGNGLNGQTHA